MIFSTIWTGCSAEFDALLRKVEQRTGFVIDRVSRHVEERTHGMLAILQGVFEVLFDQAVEFT